MITAAMRASKSTLNNIKKFLSIVSFDTNIDQYASCKNGIENPNNKGNTQIKTIKKLFLLGFLSEVLIVS